MKIEVQSSTVEERSGTIRNGDRKGESYSIRQQEAWLHNGRAYPARIVLSLPEGQQGYAPGFYSLAPESFQAGEFDRLELGRHLVLVPEAASLRSAKVA